MPRSSPGGVQLGVNIDHVATLRQARYPHQPDAGEPDPVRAAHEAELGGADGITIHLREDRRHIQDRDLHLLRRLVKVKLNLEMAATEEMVALACESARESREVNSGKSNRSASHGRYAVGPHTAMLVPEGREEVTTEGGLDVAGQLPRLHEVVDRLREAGLLVSAFIDPDLRQVEAAAEAGFDVCEVHTGPYAHEFAREGGDFRRGPLREALADVRSAGERIIELGMRFNAGHAMNYHNVRPVAAMAGVSELHIGHAIVSRAVYVGMRRAVAEMKAAMDGAGRVREC